MISQSLRDARRYEEEEELRQKEFFGPESRPAFHLCARVGWMNDPNGFCYHAGKYHMFYQYHPYDSHWGPMHWGHAVSTDLLHWVHQPAALAPDMPYDRDGCFSGSAFPLPDGRLGLIYTGVSRVSAGGEIRDLQQQCIAAEVPGSSTRDFEKFCENPLIGSEALPEHACPYDFRDPKVLTLEDGSYLMIAASLDESESGHKKGDMRSFGQMLLFKSTDAIQWTYAGKLAVNGQTPGGQKIGRMWECPDLFELDGRTVLLASAQDMLPRGKEYHNGNGSFALIGDKDPETGEVTWQRDQAVDYGIDFYAEQTVLTPDGRRVMIGWMQNWDTVMLRQEEVPWFGQMTLPRELHVRDGRILQAPVKEIEDLRQNRVEYRDVTVDNDMVTLPGVSGRTCDVTVEVDVPEGADVYHKFAMLFAANDDYHTTFSFRPEDSVAKIDRKFSGSRRAIIHQRRASVRHERGKFSFRMILDRYSVEIFVNDGETVMSATLYTDAAVDGIRFLVQGKAKLNVVKYDLCM